jgi:hypothetical protein
MADSGGLAFYTMAHPRQPRAIGSYGTGEAAATALAMSGRLVPSASSATVYVLDISRPAQPRLAGHFDAPSAPPNTGRNVTGRG